jgi:hypothetical protein
MAADTKLILIFVLQVYHRMYSWRKLAPSLPHGSELELLLCTQREAFSSKVV